MITAFWDLLCNAACSTSHKNFHNKTKLIIKRTVTAVTWTLPLTHIPFCTELIEKCLLLLFKLVWLRLQPFKCWNFCWISDNNKNGGLIQLWQMSLLGGICLITTCMVTIGLPCRLTGNKNGDGMEKVSVLCRTGLFWWGFMLDICILNYTAYIMLRLEERRRISVWFQRLLPVSMLGWVRDSSAGLHLKKTWTHSIT